MSNNVNSPIDISPDLLNSLPKYVDRKAGAKLITQNFFPTSHRTLEAWPLTWRHVNGKAIVETEELIACAVAKMNAAVPIRGGRSSFKSSQN